MIDTKQLAALYADADADNTMADEYHIAMNAALPELLAEVERSRETIALLKSNLESARVALVLMGGKP